MSEIKRIGVFTSGGDAPGMNAAVRAVVRTANYHDLHTYGIYRGYDGMINGDIKRIETRQVANILHRGGTVLKTARSKEFRTKEGRAKAYDSLMAYDIDACVVIGGDGSFTGAKIFQEEYNIPFIGLPGTIDNDLIGTDYTIGFDTACNTAIEAIDKIRDTADSHNRLFFVEVMGRHSGYIALYTGIGSGAGTVLLPETNTSNEELANILNKAAKRGKLFSVVVVAEGNKSGNAAEVAAKVSKLLPNHETKVAVIGHLQRGGSPTSFDRMLASRLGYEAVNALMAGKGNTTVGLVNNKVAFTPFDKAIGGEKPLPQDMVKMAEILGL